MLTLSIHGWFMFLRTRYRKAAGMPSRYICDVIEELRKCHKTRNYSYLPGLVEEIQTLANRMEAALQEKADYELWHKKLKEERKEYKKLLKETNKLRKQKGEEPKDLTKY